MSKNKGILVNEARAKVRQAREEANFTQKDLGKALGLSAIWVSLMESGQRNLYMEQLRTIAHTTRRSMGFFFSQDSRREGMFGKARRKLLQEFDEFCAFVAKRHYTEMTDEEIEEEIDCELDRLGFRDGRIKVFLKKLRKLKEKEREKLWQVLRNCY